MNFVDSGKRDLSATAVWLRLIAALLSWAAIFVISPLVEAATTDHWEAWTSGLKRECPANHVEWIEDGGYDDFLADFSRTLPRRLNRRSSAIAEAAMKRGCADVTAGFSCEMGAYLDAYQRLGLLQRLVDFGCRHYRCEDIAVCTRMTSTPEKHRP